MKVMLLSPKLDECGLFKGGIYDVRVEPNKNGDCVIEHPVDKKAFTLLKGEYSLLVGDSVNSPSHYVYPSFEVVDVLDEAFSDDPHLWAAGKYLLRAKRKSKEVEDLKKAIWFIERRLGVLENG